MEKQITQQVFFDTIAAHLLRQREQSKFKNSSTCQYHGPRGLKCAIGVIIPDAMYSEMMEYKSVAGLIEDYPGLGEYIPNLELARELQMTHDNTDPVYWRDVLMNVAGRFGLEWKFNNLERK
jgi:hypothetical protein